ncbi:MAG TPA: hypothetical protein VFF89_09820 [Sphingobium sp.]|nr:hypothetical protein [Sphingobium sp.]
MSDRFENLIDTPSQPARLAFAITPHATDAIDPLPKAIFVGTSGDLVGRPADSSADVTFRNLQAGQILDVRLSHIRAAGTTAADIIGLA